MKKIKLITILLFLVICLRGQTSLQSIQALKPGEKVPDMELIFHYRDSVAKPCHLSDFKGKMILLDTWATDCTPCIAGLPYMQELQEKYADKLKVIVYTAQDEKDYNKLWKVLEKRIFSNTVLDAATKLPAVLGDTIFSKLFPSPTAGTKIWIDSAGRYQAMTYEGKPSGSTVEDLWAGKKIVSDKLYIPDIWSDSQRRKWMEKRMGFTDHLLNYSVLARYDEKVRSASWDELFKIDSSTGKIIGITMLNKCIKDLYTMAWLKKGIPDNDFLALSKDPEACYSTSNKSKNWKDGVNWMENHLYCYTLQIPSTSNEDALAVMRKDLERYFGMRGSMENRKMKCWILKRITTEDKIKTKDKTAKEISDVIFEDNGEKRLVIKNSQGGVTGRILGEIKYYYFKDSLWGASACTFIDETNYKGSVDIDLPLGMGNCSVPLLRKELQKYGLDLVQEYRVRKLFVLRDISLKK